MKKHFEFKLNQKTLYTFHFDRSHTNKPLKIYKLKTKFYHIFTISIGHIK